MQVLSVLLCFYQNKICFAETYYSDSRNLYSSKNIVTNINTFFKTLLGLCHFEIVCVFVKIYFDILIKRRSIPLLVLGAVILRASIVSSPLSKSPYTSHYDPLQIHTSPQRSASLLQKKKLAGKFY